MNKALPINTQYSFTNTSDDELASSVNLYYPIQYVRKRPKGGGLDLTPITQRISFGPHLLFTVRETIKLKAAGVMVALNGSPYGIPVIGIGVGFARGRKGFMFVAINPAGVLKLLYNPGAFFKE